MIKHDDFEVNGRDGEILNDIRPNGKQEPWHLLKRNNLAVFDLLKQARMKEPAIISEAGLDNLRHCGEHLTFAVNHDTYKRHLYQAWLCHHRFCPICNRRRAKLLGYQTFKTVDVLRRRHPDVRFIFLTLTIKNVDADGLSEGIERIQRSITRLFSNGKKGIKVADDVRGQILGTIRQIEVTYNHERKDYHPHAHILIAIRGGYFDRRHYLTQARWRQLWQDAAGLDYEPMVNVKVVKGNDIRKAVNEAVKYPLKMTNILALAKEHYAEAVDVITALSFALKNKHLITFAGVFKALRAELGFTDVDKANLMKITDRQEKLKGNVEYVSYRYNWKQGLYRAYHRSKHPPSLSLFDFP